MRKNESLTIRCTSGVRNALEQIGAPARLSDTVRRALHESVERDRKRDQEQGQQLAGAMRQ